MITNLPNRNNRAIAAFSLVEVVLALSIMGFVCVTLIGLLATGMSSMQKSTATTVKSQIIQEVINNTQVHTYSTNYAATNYFDDEGTVVTTSGSAVYTATITSTMASAPNGISFNYTATDSQLLQIQVLSKSNPSVTNTFTLIWPNTGN